MMDKHNGIPKDCRTHSVSNLLPVICVTPRVTYASQVRVGERYYIDRTTLYIDRDGDAYATVLKEDGLEVGNMLLSHFKGE